MAYLCESGIILSSPVSTASMAFLAISSHLTYLNVGNIYNEGEESVQSLSSFLGEWIWHSKAQLTYHCGLMIGSTMSLLRLHTGTTMGLSCTRKQIRVLLISDPDPDLDPDPPGSEINGLKDPDPKLLISGPDPAPDPSLFHINLRKMFLNVPKSEHIYHNFIHNTWKM